MATLNERGEVLEEVDVSDTVNRWKQGGVVGTGPDGMQEIGVVASRIREDGLAYWLQPPRLYFVLAAAAALLYVSTGNRRR